MTVMGGIRMHDTTRTESGPLDAPPDGAVIFLTGALLTLGVVMVYSASVSVAGAQFNWRTWWQSPLKQAVFALAGFVFMVLTARFDYRLLDGRRAFGRWLANILYVLAAALLVVVLIPGVGKEVLGAQRWIVIYRGAFDLSFQPAEFAKIGLLIWLATFLSRPDVDVRTFSRGVLPALGGGLVLIALTGIEDYGTAALMGVMLAALLFLAGARVLHLLGILLVGVAGGAALLVLKPNRMHRIMTFLSEAPDPTGSGYQVKQALIAIGTGGWFGRGLGAGVQKYGYLPQDNNDFILAIICEELGVVGGIAIVGLFLILLLRGWWIAAHARDGLGRLLATGLTLLICLQAAFNVGVVTNSVPTKGISLPFVSAGGSGVLFLGIATGLLANVGGQVCRQRAVESKQ